MRFVKLDTPLNIQLRGRKLPDRAVELLGREPGSSHGMKEFGPCYVAWRVGLCWIVE